VRTRQTENGINPARFEEFNETDVREEIIDPLFNQDEIRLQAPILSVSSKHIVEGRDGRLSVLHLY
jgi:hypothetical protein